MADGHRQLQTAIQRGVMPSPPPSNGLLWGQCSAVRVAVQHQTAPLAALYGTVKDLSVFYDKVAAARLTALGRRYVLDVEMEHRSAPAPHLRGPHAPGPCPCGARPRPLRAGLVCRTHGPCGGGGGHAFARATAASGPSWRGFGV